MAAATTMMAYPVRDGFQGYPQQYAMYQPRPQQPPHQLNVGHSMTVNPYAPYAAAHPPTHPQPQPQPQPHYQQPAQRSPQSSGSPVSEDGFKPSLPSISNLLGIADRPGNDTRPQQIPTSVPSSEQLQSSQVSPQTNQSTDVDSRARASYAAQEASISPRSVPPPPPMRNDSVLESAHSPSTISTGSNLSGPPYFVGSSINNVEPSDQRNAQVPQMVKRPSVPSQPNVSPYGSARYSNSPYSTSPAAGSYYSPTDPSYPVPNPIYQQRPLPSNFPPQAPLPVHSTALPTSNPWEHHHYISPSSSATFPQSQDRYICSTCNKAFSRPSSLKIHSHSHTGEKPFKCPHAGCGKAFSVRSNMKRHERGCHGGMNGGHLPHPHPQHALPPFAPHPHAHMY